MRILLERAPPGWTATPLGKYVYVGSLYIASNVTYKQAASAVRDYLEEIHGIKRRNVKFV